MPLLFNAAALASINPDQHSVAEVWRRRALVTASMLLLPDSVDTSHRDSYSPLQSSMLALPVYKPAALA